LCVPQTGSGAERGTGSNVRYGRAAPHTSDNQFAAIFPPSLLGDQTRDQWARQQSATHGIAIKAQPINRRRDF
jgi:hypothetical protein